MHNHVFAIREHGQLIERQRELQRFLPAQLHVIVHDVGRERHHAFGVLLRDRFHLWHRLEGAHELLPQHWLVLLVKLEGGQNLGGIAI